MYFLVVNWRRFDIEVVFHTLDNKALYRIDYTIGSKDSTDEERLKFVVVSFFAVPTWQSSFFRTL